MTGAWPPSFPSWWMCPATPLVPDDEAEPIEAQSRWTESFINITGQGLSTSATRTAGYQIATSWGSYPRRATGNMASPAQPVSERPSGDRKSVV